MVGLCVSAYGQGQVYPASNNQLFQGSSGGFFWGNGISCIDVNKDGLDDLTIVRGNEFLRVLHNTGDGFESFVTNIFCSVNTLQILWVDYDNDGDLDLFLTTYTGVNRLFNNDGDFNFTDVTLEAGLVDAPALNYGASFADYNRDGWLDLYICRYYSPGDPLGFENKLYKNNGDGTFTDVTDQAGVGDGLRPSFMGIWIDINNDLWPDLFVINDRFPANSLYRNNGDGTFTDITEGAGVAFPNNDPMSATPGDFNNDGLIDVFMSNGGEHINMPVLLLLNNGDESFTEVADNSGFNTNEITWGAVWVDIDNDGWRDLFYCTSQLSPNHLYKNLFGDFFQNVNTEISAPIYESYISATGDFNSDGYPEIVVGNRAPSPTLLMQNSGGNNHYIKATLNGTLSNQDAIGSWIRVYRGAKSSHHYTVCGESLIGQNSQNTIFGMSSNNSLIDSICVSYPSGHIDTYYNLAVNEHYNFVEGETYSVSIFSNFQYSFCEGDSLLLDAGVHHSLLWSNGDTTQTVFINSPGTVTVTAFNEFGIQAESSIELSQLPAPQINAVVKHPDCPNTSTGLVELINETGVQPLQVTWSHGYQGNIVDSLDSDIYTYNFTDINGCVDSASIEIIDPAELVMIVATSDEIEGNDGGISVIVFGGTPPYQVFINNEASGMSTSGLTAGNYEIKVVDANGCSTFEMATVQSVLMIKDVQSTELLLFPNPTSGKVNLRHGCSLQSLSLMEISGRLLYKKTGSIAHTLDVGHLPQGTYLLKLTDRLNATYLSRLVKE